MKEVELVVPARASLGEGPCWDWRINVLYWIDINNGTVMVFDPATRRNIALDTHDYIGCVAATTGTDLLVGLRDGFFLLNPRSGGMKKLADPEAHLPENRFNDGKVDRLGRFWAGSMPIDEGSIGKSAASVGALYRMDTDLSVTKVLDGVTLSNGLAWSADDTTFYYIDTPSMGVDAFDFDAPSGRVSNRRRVIDFPQSEGVPDGLTIDRDDMLWIGHYNGGRISRWNPRTGSRVDEIFVPALHATCCTFGGDDLRDLYITTARTKTFPRDLRRFPEAGGLFRVRVDTPGVRTNLFGVDNTSE